MISTAPCALSNRESRRGCRMTVAAGEESPRPRFTRENARGGELLGQDRFALFLAVPQGTGPALTRGVPICILYRMAQEAAKPKPTVGEREMSRREDGSNWLAEVVNAQLF